MITARVWREKRQRYLNEVAKCRTCGRSHYPPRPVCDHCHGKAFDSVRMADTGRVLTWSVIRVAPPAFTQEVPYVVAILEMDDATRMMAQMADVAPEEMAIDMRVRLEFRKVRQHGRTGIIAYAHKAVPA